jgi:hypothetical protein
MKLILFNIWLSFNFLAFVFGTIVKDCHKDPFHLGELILPGGKLGCWTRVVASVELISGGN